MTDSQQTLTLQDFSFEVPPALIAQQPVDRRTDSRLLIAGRSGPIRHCQFTDIVDELPPRAVLILNRSRVIPSRLFGRLPTGGKVEIFLLEPRGDKDEWHVLGRPGRKLKNGVQIEFEGGVSATVVNQDPLRVRFTGTDNLHQWLDGHGYIPLPPYISRENPEPAQSSPDRLRYQTVYAQERGSVAAPTAGLHFDESILSALADRGVTVAEVCLHVGGGTFLPVKTQNPAEHQMHAETFLVPQATVDTIAAAQQNERPVIPVGTTAFRAVESFFTNQVDGGEAKADTWLRTRLFVRPETRTCQHEPAVASGMITNFHQPESTLFMLVSALLGFDRAHEVYREAIAREYRLFSYGDSSFLSWR